MIFSLYDISLLEKDTAKRLPSNETDYYPLTKYRIRILYDYLLSNDETLKDYYKDKSDFDKNFIAYINKIKTYLEDKDDLNVLKEKGKEIELFENTLPNIIYYFNSTVKANKFNPIHASDLFIKLGQDYPINEYENKPIDIASIIFCGWIFHFKLDTEYKEEEYACKRRTLMRLLMKSLFSTYVHQEYLIYYNSEHINEKRVNKKVK